MLCGIIGFASSSHFVASSSVIITLSIPDSISKNGLSDLIQIWHVDVTAPQGVLYSFVTLNSYW